MPPASTEDRTAAGPLAPPIGSGRVRPIATLTALFQSFRRARRAPDDPEALLALADLLIRLRAPALGHRYAVAALRLRPLAGRQKQALGEMLFKVGSFDAAYRLLRGGPGLDSEEAKRLRLMAALTSDRGETERARRYLARSVLREPVSAPPVLDAQKLTVVRLRAVDNSAMRIGYDAVDRVHTAYLSGGHFSTKNLLHRRLFNVLTLDLTENGPSDFSVLADSDVAINMIGCAERNPAALARLASLLDRHPGLPVVNAPQPVLATSRAEAFRVLGALPGVTFPKTVLFANDAAPAELARDLERSGFDYPLIVRRPGTHTGTSMVKLDDRASLVAHLGTMPRHVKLYAIQYIDCRGANGCHSKTRVFRIDGRLYPAARVSSDQWQIHSADRYRVMTGRAALRAEERAYLKDPAGFFGTDHWAALNRVGDTIGLDFLGIDFTVDPLGRLVVFEANAAMRHNFDHAGAFPYTRPYLRRISDAFTSMIEDRAARRGSADRIQMNPILTSNAPETPPTRRPPPSFLAGQRTSRRPAPHRRE